jgi:hypothetical protein
VQALRITLPNGGGERVGFTGSLRSSLAGAIRARGCTVCYPVAWSWLVLSLDFVRSS